MAGAMLDKAKFTIPKITISTKRQTTTELSSLTALHPTIEPSTSCSSVISERHSNMSPIHVHDKSLEILIAQLTLAQDEFLNDEDQEDLQMICYVPLGPLSSDDSSILEKMRAMLGEHELPAPPHSFRTERPKPSSEDRGENLSKMDIAAKADCDPDFKSLFDYGDEDALDFEEGDMSMVDNDGDNRDEDEDEHNFRRANKSHRSKEIEKLREENAKAKSTLGISTTSRDTAEETRPTSKSLTTTVERVESDAGCKDLISNELKLKQDYLRKFRQSADIGYTTMCAEIDTRRHWDRPYARDLVLFAVTQLIKSKLSSKLSDLYKRIETMNVKETLFWKNMIFDLKRETLPLTMLPFSINEFVKNIAYYLKRNDDILISYRTAQELNEILAKNDYPEGPSSSFNTRPNVSVPKGTFSSFTKRPETIVPDGYLDPREHERLEMQIRKKDELLEKFERERLERIRLLENTERELEEKKKRDRETARELELQKQIDEMQLQLKDKDEELRRRERDARHEREKERLEREQHERETARRKALEELEIERERERERMRLTMESTRPTDPRSYRKPISANPPPPAIDISSDESFTDMVPAVRPKREPNLSKPTPNPPAMSDPRRRPQAPALVDEEVDIGLYNTPHMNAQPELFAPPKVAPRSNLPSRLVSDRVGLPPPMEPHHQRLMRLMYEGAAPYFVRNVERRYVYVGNVAPPSVVNDCLAVFDQTSDARTTIEVPYDQQHLVPHKRPMAYAQYLALQAAERAAAEAEANRTPPASPVPNENDTDLLEFTGPSSPISPPPKQPNNLDNSDDDNSSVIAVPNIEEAAATRDNPLSTIKRSETITHSPIDPAEQAPPKKKRKKSSIDLGPKRPGPRSMTLGDPNARDHFKNFKISVTKTGKKVHSPAESGLPAPPVPLSNGVLRLTDEDLEL